MKVFVIKSINPMGDYDEEWGQTFWAHVEEQQMPVKFTKQIKYTPAIGSKIVAEEHEVKQGAKGDFMALKKVKLEDTGQNQTTIVPPPDDQVKLLELIWADIKEILERVKTLQGDIDDETANQVFND